MKYIRDLSDSSTNRAFRLFETDNSRMQAFCHAYLQPGKATVPHHLKHQSEVYYVLSGEGLMHIDDEAGSLSVGQAVYIPPRATQWIENTGEGELVFLAICSPQWAGCDEEILDSSDNSEIR